MKKSIFILILLYLTPLYAEQKTAILFGMGREYYTWKEFGAKDKVVLTEKGPLQVLDIVLTYREEEIWNLIEENNYSFDVKLKTSFYDGRINYDGEVQGEDQNKDKFYTKTDISGFNSDLGYYKDIFIKKGYSLRTHFGIGVDKWTRYINSGESSPAGYPSNRSSIRGYNEKYTYGYADISIIIKSRYEEKANYEFEMGTIYPFYSNEVVEFKKLGYLNNLEVEPGKEFSPYTRLSFLPKKGFKVDLFINSKLLLASNEGEVSYYNESDNRITDKFLQPKSLQIRYGFKFQYQFSNQ